MAINFDGGVGGTGEPPMPINLDGGVGGTGEPPMAIYFGGVGGTGEPPMLDTLCLSETPVNTTETASANVKK